VTAHAIQWVTAAPLWRDTLRADVGDRERSERMRAPALLRFEHDSFMEDIAALLAHDPGDLVGKRAEPISYRLPSPGETEAPAPPLLKLYQAIHGHFNLVAATLVCRRPGLPEHDVDTAAKEQVAFVLRRHDPDGTEWAWVDKASWKSLSRADARAVAKGEEMLPLFPLRYRTPDRAHNLFVGLVPTSSGETFKAAGTLSPLAEPGSGEGAGPADPRPDAFRNLVTDPMRALDHAPPAVAAEVADPDNVLSGEEKAKIAAGEAERQVEASSFALLDFAEYLVTTVPVVWTALQQQRRPGAAGPAALYDRLASARPDSGYATTFAAALRTAWRESPILMGDAEGPSSLRLNLRNATADPATLEALVEDALPPLDSAAPATSIQGHPAEPPPVPKLDARGESRYAIRCVYRRPQCPPSRRDTVSEPSRPFQIAGFFDFDAPARAINIALPIDTSIKDLRKLRKNVNVLLSNQLREQMNRVTDMKKALDGEFGDGKSVDVGLLCSFSIPIITICALIVLMIFISLLNIVFWWLPFLRICFPIQLKAK
jgi:hypothetical protein